TPREGNRHRMGPARTALTVAGAKGVRGLPSERDARTGPRDVSLIVESIGLAELEPGAAARADRESIEAEGHVRRSVDGSLSRPIDVHLESAAGRVFPGAEPPPFNKCPRERAFVARPATEDLFCGNRATGSRSGDDSGGGG